MEPVTDVLSLELIHETLSTSSLNLDVLGPNFEVIEMTDNQFNDIF